LFLLVLMLGLVLYESLWLWGSGGQTIGKAFCNLTVCRIDGTAPAHTWRGLVWSLGRHGVGYTIADVFGLGILTALGPSRRCVHAYLFSSQVIIRPDDADLLARLDDYVKRLDAGVEASSKRYASLVSLWKKLTKLLKYPALVVIFVAGQDPGSPLGRM